MTERRGTKALELWCRRITDGYPGVNVQNMTTSWRDGLAFCAMIHHFRPDLIDFDSLNKDDVYGNNELAFRTAAEHLGIPALLDAEDMASCSVPDRLSILTYLSQFYQNFGGSSPSRLALSRSKESSNEGISPVVAESTKPKIGPRVGMRREPCAVCGMPVFLAEKLVISRTPYHRTCFRCARCSHQLTPGNYYETEDGQYCCETCPDEEETAVSSSSSSSAAIPRLHEAYNESVMLGHHGDQDQRETSVTSSYQRSLSDEEKTERRAQLTEEILDRPLVHTPGSSMPKERRSPEEATTAENISQTAQMRLSFMASQMLSQSPEEDTKKSSSEEEEEFSSGSTRVEGAVQEARRRGGSSPPGDDFAKRRRSPEGASDDRIADVGRVEAAKEPWKFAKERGSSHEFSSVDIGRSSRSIFSEITDDNVKLDDSLEDAEDNSDKTRRRSFDTATSEATQRNKDYSHLDDKDASVGQDTKDKLGLVDDARDEDDDDERREEDANTSQCLSLVQRRLRMFENPETVEKRKGEGGKNSPSSPGPDGSSFVDGERISDEIRQEDKIREEPRPEISLESEEITKDEICSSRTEEEDELDVSEDNLISSDKTENKLPPVVPKRVGLEARKAARSRAKNAEVTVLNASGIDLSAEEIYPEDLNPFKSDEEDEEVNEDVRANFENSRSSRVSTNPFGSSDEDEEESPKVVAPPRPATRSNVAAKKSPQPIREDVDEAPTKRLLKAPQIHLNPFWSDDDEEPESEDEIHSGVQSLPANTPVPKPRTIKASQRKSEFERGDIYASNSSLGSTGSTSTPGGTYRKKKPAPPPPIAKELFASGADSLLSPNRRTYTGSNNSLHTTPRARKAKPAPPPPLPTSTPYSVNLMANLALTESPIIDSEKITESEDYKTWEDPKIGKDEANRSRQSASTISRDEANIYGGYADKSVQGKWKRKKGPAPARPIPHRRKIKVMSLKDVKLELDEIEMQQQGLEKQGVRLEQLIRDKAETGNAAEETSLGMDVEELVLELFVLVNEKNELFRRQAELMLLRRQQRLEEEHADIEYQIRCLLCQPEATKTDFDKQREETLIQRLVEIVERRNEIVECLEMDRRREVEEDRSINTQMGLYAAKNKGDFAKELEDEAKNRARKSKKNKLKEKAKEKILRKGHKKDADKDVDETEVKLKRQNKRKWF